MRGAPRACCCPQPIPGMIWLLIRGFFVTRFALLAAASVLAMTGSYGSAAELSASASATVHAKRLEISRPGIKTLYSQNDNDGGFNVPSLFDSTYSAYNDQAADDFVIPIGRTWKIREVDVTGVYFNGSGPANFEVVTFYRDAQGLPGQQIGAFEKSVGADNDGSLAIPIAARRLKAGNYWVSVQVNCPFTNGCGEWAWEGRSVQANNPAAWRFQNCNSCSPCPNWRTLQSCLGVGPDLMFAIKGSERKNKDAGPPDAVSGLSMAFGRSRAS